MPLIRCSDPPPDHMGAALLANEPDQEVHEDETAVCHEQAFTLA